MSSRGAPPPRAGRVRIGGGAPIALIAGPCVLEHRDFVLQHAERLHRIAEADGFPFVFKASFDKANRTRASSPRGPGLDDGLRLLEEVRSAQGVPVLTDVHEPAQCALVAEVVDVLQVPAFLCRQTDLLVAAGATGRPVNVKKGQFMAAEDMRFAVEKVNGPCLLTERGTMFGYRDLIVDFRNLPILRRHAPVVFDGTHSVQRPGATDGRSGGRRDEVPGLVRAAVACGVDGLFLEVHPDPDRAPSDGPNSLTYAGLQAVLSDVSRLQAHRGAPHDDVVSTAIAVW